jgi:peptidoglycan/LPS O-acetylase OafA/YrhL
LRFAIACGAPSRKPAIADIPRPRLEARPPIPSLTGLRFFAAFFILFGHAVGWIAQFTDSNVGSYFSFVGMYGMPLFFVLSGFVIHYNYRDLFLQQGISRAVCEFAAARFARLYPLYFVLLLFATGMDGFVPRLYNAPQFAVPIITQYLSLTQSWWYQIYEGQSIIYWVFGISWSISTEMFFYAAYAALIFPLMAICKPRQTILVIVSYIVLIIGALGLCLHEQQPLLTFAQHHVPSYIGPDKFEHSFFRWLFYFSPYFRVFEFILGCLAAQAFIEIAHLKVSPREHRIATAALALALTSLLLFGVLYLGLLPTPQLNAYIQFYALNFLCAPSIAIILFCVARYDTPFGRLMSTPLVVSLGEISYSIYLVHFFTLRLFQQPPIGFDSMRAIDAIFRVVCAIGLTLLVSYATYRLIEVPGRDWIRDRLRRGIASVFSERGRHIGISKAHYCSPSSESIPLRTS